MTRWQRLLLPALLCAGLAGCDQSMTEQNKLTVYAPDPSFPDGASARPLVPGVVPHAPSLTQAKARPPLTMALLHRGQQRFRIYCEPCHGALGNGNGILPAYGFPHPPSYTSQKLLKAPDSHYYDVITHGKGKMYSYADRVSPADRWAIIDYIRALQLSQHATLADVPAGTQLTGSPP